jgi:hypothetical protein
MHSRNSICIYECTNVLGVELEFDAKERRTAAIRDKRDLIVSVAARGSAKGPYGR